MLIRNRQCNHIGRCNCNVPELSCPTQPQRPPRVDPDIIASMLVQTISCGNTDLAEYLTKISNIVVKRHGYCSNELMFISAQIELVDAAMLYARNYVDYSDGKSQSKSLQRSRYKSKSEAKAQGTSQSRSCGFSDAASFNQFNRESYDRSRSQSTTDSESSGRSDSNTYDRSLQQASGISQVGDTARSETRGQGEGEHDEVSGNAGGSYSRTSDNPGINVNDIDPGNASLGNVFNLIGEIFDIWWSVETSGSYEWDPEGSNDYEFNYDNFEQPAIFGGDVTDIFDDTIDQNYTDPGAQNVTSDNIPSLICCCDNRPFIGFIGDCEELGIPGQCHWMDEFVYPTIGEGFSVDYNINVGLDVLKKGLSFDVSWGRSSRYSQSHVVTKACTSGFSNSNTQNFYDQVDWSRAHGETYTNDQSSTQRDYHVRADSERDSHSRTDAGSAATGDAESKSESGAERSAHNESRSSSQGTNWSKSRARGNSLTKSDSESNSIAENLSDIFTALSKMYDILVGQRKLYKQRFIAQQGVAIGSIETCYNYAIPPDPVVASRLRSLQTKWYNQTCCN